MLQPPRKSLSIRVQPLRRIISRLNNRLHQQGRLLLQMQWHVGSFQWWLPSTHVHPPQHQVTRITRAHRATMFYFSKVAQWFRRTGAGIIQYRRQYTVNLIWWFLRMLTADLAQDPGDQDNLDISQPLPPSDVGSDLGVGPADMEMDDEDNPPPPPAGETQ